MKFDFGSLVELITLIERSNIPYRFFGVTVSYWNLEEEDGSTTMYWGLSGLPYPGYPHGLDVMEDGLVVDHLNGTNVDEKSDEVLDYALKEIRKKVLQYPNDEITHKIYRMGPLWAVEGGAGGLDSHDTMNS